MYDYRATVLRVVDGDTVDITIDLGFTIKTDQRVRLQGINAPEVATEAGKAARDFLKEQLPPGKAVWVFSHKPGGGDKYGRYLARIYDGKLMHWDYNDMMIDHGHAVPWDGTGAKP